MVMTYNTPPTAESSVASQPSSVASRLAQNFGRVYKLLKCI